MKSPLLLFACPTLMSAANIIPGKAGDSFQKTGYQASKTIDGGFGRHNGWTSLHQRKAVTGPGLE